MTAENKISKRQRRKDGLNKSNTWPSIPNIQKPELRAKAYLRIAGLGPKDINGKGKNNNDKTNLLDDSPEMKFGRMLGCTDERTRHTTVLKLKQYLKTKCKHMPSNSNTEKNKINENNENINSNHGISILDLLKLWKGLFHCLYMADKVPVQEELSTHIADLLWCFEGTEEEDECAGQTYMDMFPDDNDDGDDEGGDEGDENENNDDNDDESDDDDDDDSDVVMTEIVNTLDNPHNNNNDDDSEEEEDDDEEQDDDEYDDEYDYQNVKHCRGAHLSSLYLSTFLQTIKREWCNIDKYRIDKFYSLIRKIISNVYMYMCKRHWNIGIIRLFNDTIHEEILSAGITECSNGIKYHLIDISLDELNNINSSPNVMLKLTEATFIDVLEPYFALLQTSSDNIIHKRIVDNMLLKFLNNYSILNTTNADDDSDDSDSNSDEEEQEDEDNNSEKKKKVIMDNIHVGTVAEFIFALASDTSTLDDNRKILYDVHKSYMKCLEKNKGKDLDLSNIINDDADEDYESDNNDNDKDDDEDDIGIDEAIEQFEQENDDVIDDDDDDDDDDDMEDEKIIEKKKSKKDKKQKKNKKKDKKRKLSDDDSKDDQEEEEQQQQVKTKKKKKAKVVETSQEAKEEAKIKSNKKKQKKQKNFDDIDDDDDNNGNDNAIIESPKDKKKKKKNKKTNKKQEEEDDHDVDDDIGNNNKKEKEENEENNTPSPSSSKHSSNKKKKKKRGNDDDDENNNNNNKGSSEKKQKNNKKNVVVEKKRVSFGKVNRAKSHKASMKALNALTSVAKPPVTPDKSILQTKEETKKINEKLLQRSKEKLKGKGGKSNKRRKAIDYF